MDKTIIEPAVASGTLIYDTAQLREQIMETRSSDAPMCGPVDDVVDLPDNPDLSTGETSRADALRRLYKDPRGPLRPYLFGGGDMALALSAIASSSPHFAEMLGFVERAARLSELTGAAMRLPPVLLLGEPGLGKTYVSSRLGEALGGVAARIALNAVSDTQLFLGHPTTWRGAKMGVFTRALVECRTASPVIVLDEVDKLTSLWQENAYAPLLTVLEPENAQSARDEYLLIDFNLSAAIVIGTANEVKPIPAPVLDRFMVIEVPPPKPAQLVEVVASITQSVIETYGGIAMPGKDVVKALARKNPRFVRKIIEVALGFAAKDGRRTLAVADVGYACAMLNAPQKAQKARIRRGEVDL